MQDVSEERITELGVDQLPEDRMAAQTINQTFQQRPTEHPYVVNYPQIEALDNPESFRPAQLSLF